ncbi:MAG: hypothetical protein OSJ55_10045, partial [Bacteroidales bacterium]|nr:hypothetical protein [Bacteroidales bacterium]
STLEKSRKNHPTFCPGDLERNFWMNTSRDIIETITAAGIYDLRMQQSSAISYFLSTLEKSRKNHPTFCPGDREI